MGRGTQDRMFSKSPLTREEEIEVAKQILSPDPDVSGRAVEKMVLHNARFVRRAVKQCVPIYDSRADDLIQEGLLGMIQAAVRYDYRKGDVRFITYARAWVMGRITKALSACWRRNASLDNPPIVSGVDPPPPGLYAQGEDDEDESQYTIEELIADPTQHTDRLVEACLAKRAIRRVIGRLRPSHQLVLGLRYGIGGQEPMTIEDVGASLGRSPSDVWRIEQAAIARMKTLIQSNENN